MARANFVKSARKEIPEAGIKVGDSYWWWKFKNRPRSVSKSKPKRSQLTQSSFYSSIYDLEDDVIGSAIADNTLPDLRDDVVSQLEDLRDEAQSSLDNMPEGLQEGPTGQLLQERVDALENAINEFESLELYEPDDDDLVIDDIEREENDSDEDFQQRLDDARREAVDTYWDEKLQEFQNVSIDAP